jgi:hypothetical protein
MGGSVAAPINEAVFLLNELDPKILDTVREQFPQLGPELALGKEGGENEVREELDLDRAQVMLRALDVAKKRAENELNTIRQRISASRERRLWSQIASLICSSGVLASLALSQKGLVTVITALLALLASIGTMISEHQERLLKQGDGDIYDAFEKASQAAYRAGLMAENIRLLVKHKVGSAEIRTALESANLLCEELNSWITKMSGSN